MSNVSKDRELTWVTVMPTEKMMIGWAKAGLNVLLIGKHGVGKTTLIRSVFDKLGWTHRYFSASTMDPWVDFIGVPREQKDEKGSYLDLVKPKPLRDGEIEALFFDEYNRAPKKVQNAVMELIQFGSINGEKMPKLKVVWAAINEDDDSNEYNVDKLDPAQMDRFHVIVKLPEVPDKGYFEKQFGLLGPIIVNWWARQDDVTRNFVSPRRLSAVLEAYLKDIDIRNMLPANANVTVLLKELNVSKMLKGLKAAMDDPDALRKWLLDEEQYKFALTVGNTTLPDSLLWQSIDMDRKVSLLKDKGYRRFKEYIQKSEEQEIFVEATRSFVWDTVESLEMDSAEWGDAYRDAVKFIYEEITAPPTETDRDKVLLGLVSTSKRMGKLKPHNTNVKDLVPKRFGSGVGPCNVHKKALEQYIVDGGVPEGAWGDIFEQLSKFPPIVVVEIWNKTPKARQLQIINGLIEEVEKSGSTLEDLMDSWVALKALRMIGKK